MKKIMIVDDEEGIAVLLETIFADLAETYIFTNSEQARDSVAKIKPDVLVTDQKMPVVTGLELIKAGLAELPHLKVVLISGDVSFSQEAKELGRQNMLFFEKPLDDLINFRDQVMAFADN